MPCSVQERVIGYKPVVDTFLLFPNYLAELERQSCGDWYCAWNIVIVVNNLRGAARCKHPTNDIRGVIIADACDQRVEIGCLPAKRSLGQCSQVQPDRYW